MIRRVVTASIVAGAFALAGCAPPGTGGFVAPTVQSVGQFILNTCAFNALATSASIQQLQALINAAIPGLVTVEAIGNEVCKVALAAIPPPATRLRGAATSITVKVGGFPITGKFIQ